MKIFRRSSLICCSFIFCVVACKESKQASSNTTQENREAKRIIQGIWLDEETEDVTFWMKGDSILYADSTIQQDPRRHDDGLWRTAYQVSLEEVFSE